MSISRLLTAAAAAVAMTSGAAAQTPAKSKPAKAAPAVAPAAAATPAAQPTGDLVATAQAAGRFTTFLKAADATQLTPVLKNPGPITVFAPTDAAFAAMPPGELDRLMQPANLNQLQKLLLAHVVNTKVLKSQIAGAKGEVQNGAGANLSIDGSGEAVKVNGATIVEADVLATNGVIHVIDQVMLPGGANANAAGAAATPPGAGTSASASAASEP